MASPLSADEIADLLKSKPSTGRKPATKTTSVQPLERPIQIGPLKYHELPNKRCASKGCAAPTLISVSGVPYCSSHALYKLNQMILIDSGVNVDECECNAGKHSMGNVHTSDCPLYRQNKNEDISDDSSGSDAGSPENPA